MTHYDVFNGDADGICALQQLRLARSCTSTLVTGVKRDNALLARVIAGEGDTVTVLDVSYRRNGDDVKRLLAAGARIRYIDHHDPGAVAEHSRLEVHIDTAPRMTTGLIVDRLLGGAHHRWAIVSAFGDNHLRLATRLCADAGLAPDETEVLRGSASRSTTTATACASPTCTSHPTRSTASWRRSPTRWSSRTSRSPASCGSATALISPALKEPNPCSIRRP